MNKRPRSSVWNHFQKDDDPEYAICVVGGCRTKIKQSCGNTSNLLKHLKTQHVKQHEECIKEIQENSEKRKRMMSRKATNTQPTLAQTLERAQCYPKESAKRRKIDKALLVMIATDLQPMSIVDDKGFQNFVQCMDPRYETPSRQTLTRSIPDLYEEIKGKLQKELDSCKYVAVTTDIWTSLQTKSYCCVTVHYITMDWLIRSALLETFEFDTAHTAVNIRSELLRVASAYNLADKIVCAVTDNASNMVSAIRETSWRHLPCFAHSLNLVVQDSIKEDTELGVVKEKCKDVVSHFHRSVKSADKLRVVQKQISVPEHKLIQEVSTRWNSTYLMFERFNEQFEAITTTLCLMNNNNLCLASEDKTQITNALTVLKPFLEATENISGQEYVSVSMILPLTKFLQKKCSSCQSSTTLATTLTTELCRRFSSLEISFTTAVTTLLDPRFKKLPFSGTSAIDQTISRVTQEMSSLNIQQSPDTDDTNNSESTSSTCSLWDDFDKRVTQSRSHRTRTSDSLIEVRQYFEEPNIDRIKNPLEWWKNNENKFPRLQQLAKKYLCIPGSSVPSERLFSKAGQLVSERRNRIKPKNIDMMLFLNHNLKIFS